MKLIKLKRRKPNRSVGGDIGIYILLILFGIFFVLPLVYSISSAFKPLDEIYLYPPRFFVKNPTFNNFQDLLVVMSSSYVPFTRYVFNTGIYYIAWYGRSFDYWFNGCLCFGKI